MKVKNYVNEMLKEKLLQNIFILYSGFKTATFPSLLDFNFIRMHTRNPNYKSSNAYYAAR